ncbi:MAG: hypothetical protein P1U74_01980 [Legionellaceae bacterium]|nr:hypothetical protein [Legionellaceae bacterium]
MSGNDFLAKELSILRAEVENIRLQQEIDSKNTQEESLTSHTKADDKSHVKKNADETVVILNSILDQLKNEYENLSPVSSLLIFSLGVVLGSLISKRNGAKL